MKSKSAQKIKLASFDSLLGLQETVTGDSIVCVTVRLFHTCNCKKVWDATFIGIFWI